MTAVTATDAVHVVDVEPPERQAARQLEAFFLRQFLAEARPRSSMLGGGFAGDTFRDMLDGAMADAMAAAGGLGLATTFEAALGAEPATQAPPVHAAGAALLVAASASPAHLHPPTVTEAPEGARPAADEAWILPVQGRRSSGFGARVDPIGGARGYHSGVDIAAREGTPVVAARAGTVERAGPAGTYGNLIVLRHADGSETRYAHLSAIAVRPGDTVAAGAPIGAVGSTGRSTGPHLHFEVRRNGRPMDPWAVLDGSSPSTPPGSGRP